jgi:hypothetical protein
MHKLIIDCKRGQTQMATGRWVEKGAYLFRQLLQSSYIHCLVKELAD